MLYFLYFVIGLALAMGYTKAKGWESELIGNIGFFKFIYGFLGIVLWWPFWIGVGLGTVFWAWVERNSDV